jgi:hypothetical protein
MVECSFDGGDLKRLALILALSPEERGPALTIG